MGVEAVNVRTGGMKSPSLITVGTKGCEARMWSASSQRLVQGLKRNPRSFLRSESVGHGRTQWDARWHVAHRSDVS
jgi:hypothetical protein